MQIPQFPQKCESLNRTIIQIPLVLFNLIIIEILAVLEISAGSFAAQMDINRTIIQRNQFPVFTFGAAAFRLDANTIFPLIGTYRRITALFFLHTVPTTGKYILPATEQTAEQPDFFIQRTELVNTGWVSF